MFRPLFVVSKLFSLCTKPCSCSICGEMTDEHFEICTRCQNRFRQEAIQKINEEGSLLRCCKCGRPLISEQVYCSYCVKRLEIPFVDSCYPLFFYTPANQNLVTSWKIGEKRFLSFFFANIIQLVILNLFPKSAKVPILVPVPPRPGKIKKKGWDQVEELVSILKRVYTFDVLHCLKRTSKFEQKKLGREERLLNLCGTIRYECTQSPPKSVILIDDLMTTGATLSECSATLKNAGVETVFAITLFFD